MKPLYNRRFLGSVLKREIELCRRCNIGFAVLMIDVDHFKRIEETEMLLPNDRRLRVTVSVDIAASDGHPDYERIVDRADAALYQAKNGGRNRVCGLEDTAVSAG